MTLQMFAVLQEWSTGKHDKQAFDGNVYHTIYDNHMKNLATARTKNLAGYHTLMHYIYNTAL